jgi:hypothetical protein
MDMDFIYFFVSPSWDVPGTMFISNKDKSIKLAVPMPLMWEKLVQNNVRFAFMYGGMCEGLSHIQLVDFVDEYTHYRLIEEWADYQFEQEAGHEYN